MAKIREAVISPPLGLSNVPYLTVSENKSAFFLPEGEENVCQATLERGAERSSSDKTIRMHVKRYPWGEMFIRSFPKPEVDREGQRSKPPTNNGERVQENGLSKRGKSTLRKAANMYQWRYERTNMITVGYGDTSISGHRESKGDLDRFLKTLRRDHVKHSPDVPFEYLWVAEIQEKRLKRTGEAVIHYHILTPHYFKKSKINDGWNVAVNKPREKKGLPTQTLLPNVIKAYHAGRYIGKYLQKEGHRIEGRGYGMSQASYKGIEPSFEGTFDLTPEQAYEAEEHIHFNVSGRIEGAKEIGDKTDAVYWRWFSDAPEYPVTELLKYHLEGNESVKFEDNGRDQEQRRQTEGIRPKGSENSTSYDQTGIGTPDGRSKEGEQADKRICPIQSAEIAPTLFP